jgi:hypothetical protein
MHYASDCTASDSAEWGRSWHPKPLRQLAFLGRRQGQRDRQGVVRGRRSNRYARPWILALAACALTSAAAAQAPTPAPALRGGAPAPTTATPPSPGPLVANDALLDTPEYKAAIQDAVNEFRVGNWAEAMTLFREAHRLYPNARTLRGLGIVAFELRQYVDAVSYLKQALTDQRKALDPTQRRDAIDQIARAERFVARLVLTVEPASATVTVDGGPPTYNEQHELLLAAGERVVQASAPGYDTQAKRIVVEGEQRVGLTLSLVPTPAVATAPAPAPASASADGHDSGLSIPLGPAIVAGAGAALLIVSAVTGSLALSAQSDLEDACPQKNACAAGNQDTADKADSLALATDVLWVTGAVAVAGGVTWWLLGKHHDDTQVGAVVTHDRAALSLQQRF